MFDYQKLKDKFYHLAEDAENNVRKDKLKAQKAPPVYEGLHDINLAKRDLYNYLAISHFENKQDFISALNQLLERPAKTSNAFNEQKYAESYASYVKKLIDEHR